MWNGVGYNQFNQLNWTTDRASLNHKRQFIVQYAYYFRVGKKHLIIFISQKNALVCLMTTEQSLWQKDNGNDTAH